MKRLLPMAMVALALMLIVAPAFAANFTVNLVGVWQGKATGVDFLEGMVTPEYTNNNITIVIINQNGDRFYGEINNTEMVYKINGVISGGKIYAAGGQGRVITMELPFLEQGSWRMTGVMQSGGPADGVSCMSGKFTVHRTSP